MESRFDVIALVAGVPDNCESSELIVDRALAGDVDRDSGRDRPAYEAQVNHSCLLSTRTHLGGTVLEPIEAVRMLTTTICPVALIAVPSLHPRPRVPRSASPLLRVHEKAW